MRHREAPFTRPTVLVFLLALVISPKADGVSATDVTAPAAIVDLVALPPLVAPQLHTTLSWTTPGDDGNIGTATSYDIRFRTGGPITEANWGASTQVSYGMSSGPVSVLVPTEPTPQAAGTPQSFTVVGLKPNTTYFWAIKATDEAGNISGVSNSASRTTAKYEGYGYQATGGGEKAFCEVTSLNPTGAGSISACIGDNKYVVFSVHGNIVMTDTIDFTNSNITLDGSTAPSPGITFTTTSAYPFLNDGFRVGAYGSETQSHVIVTYLRFKGLMEFPPYQGTSGCGCSCDGCKYGEDILTVMGGAGASRIVIDHITTEYSEDSGADVVGGPITDLTFSYSFVWRSAHPMLMDSNNSARHSFHHNLVSENMDRAARFQKTATDMDFVNNLEFWGNWDPSGGSRQYHTPNQVMTLSNEAGHPTDINIINNYWVPWPCAGISGCADRSNKQLVYGTTAGYDSNEGGSSYSGCKKQGTVWTSGTPMSGAEIYVSGNVFPASNCDEYSTISSPRPTPAVAQVTTDPAAGLWATVLPGVGTLFRTPEEQTLIDSASTALHPSGTCGNNIKESGETCDGSDLGGATCASQGFSGGGTLRCSSNCLSFDASQCIGNLPPGTVLNLRRTDTTSP